jgi:endonuclease YncB( thermonuclease family)
MSLILHPPKLGMVTHLPHLLLICFAVFLFPYFCFADFTGLVVSVLDGDTIEVLHNQQPERIRLNGIDARRDAKPGDSMWWKTSS